MARIMLIEGDEKRKRELMQHLKKQPGVSVQALSSGMSGLRSLLTGDAASPDLVIYRMEKENDALEIIKSICKLHDNLPVIALTSHGKPQLGLQAMEAGAEQFLVSPFYPEQLCAAIHSCLQKRDLQHEVQRRLNWHSIINLWDIAPKSKVLQSVVRVARNATMLDMPIIFQGEDGVGKELLARAIHSSGKNRDHPFIGMNLAIVRQDVIKRELFGGANVPGALNRTGEGSLFLRGLHYLPEKLENQLLESLHDPRRFKGRIMLALPDMTEEYDGHERFLALQAISIAMPRLKDIREDIPLLAELICRHYACREGKPIHGISTDAQAFLQDITWPGNLRELANALFHAVMHCNGHELKPEDFVYLFRKSPQTGTVVQLGGKNPTQYNGKVLSCFDDSGNVKRLEEVEREMIRLALECYNGQMAKAARKLGIGRSTLYRKLAMGE